MIRITLGFSETLPGGFQPNQIRTFITSFTLFLLLLNFSGLRAQTADKNYVLTLSPRTKISDPAKLQALSGNKDSVSTTIQYLDGLGRPVQTVSVKGSPGAKDIVQPIAYDALGREARKYLPYVHSGLADGSYRPDALVGTGGYTGSSQYQFYQQTGQKQATSAYPFAETAFEASPLNRVLEQGAPGQPWQLSSSGVAGSGHSVKLDYASNDATSLTAGTGFWAKQYGVNVDINGLRTITHQGAYLPNQLYVSISKDENWVSGKAGTTEEYKDKEGHVVLKRTFNLKNGTSETLSTYYVYDDFGNLCYVLPPILNADNLAAAPSQATLDLLAYQYRYDGRQRLVEKKVPGKAIENFVYNKLDQLVAREDGNLRGRKSWEYSKYDALGRLIATGWWKHYVGTTITLINRDTLQAQVDAFSGPLWEARSNSGLGYDNLAWPVTTDFFVVNYYDDYNVFNLPASFVFESYIPLKPSDNVKSERTQGLPTVVMTASIEWSDRRWTVSYYNADGRVIQVQKNNKVAVGALTSENGQAGKDIINNEYDFPGNLTLSIRKHTSPVYPVSPLLVRTRYSYDHADRLVDIHKRIGTAPATDPEVKLVNNEYNELGQLIDKKLHLKSGQTKHLQSVDYRYNIRGWLSSVNDPTLATTANSFNEDNATSDADKFGMSLAYENAPILQYNGNIGRQSWKSANSAAYSFDYRYDPLSRLLQAESSTAGVKDRNYSEYLSYDVMGNIQTLGRSANVGGRKNIDSLTYTYNTAKQVTRVDDNSVDVTNRLLIFSDNGSVVAAEMAYDTNGNLTKDLNKKLSNISYSVIDKPQVVTTTEGHKINYEYERNGVKLRKTFTEAGSGNVSKTDYLDGIHYEKSPGQPVVLSFIQTEEGRAAKNGASFTYQYDLKDHLGNTRTSIQPLSSDTTQTTADVIQENAYYPFGADMPNVTATLAGTNKYLYNGKEKQDELGGLYDYGARFYDPTVGRWNAVDPLAEKFSSISPYNYTDNNPANNTDPDGMDIIYGANSTTYTGADAQAALKGFQTANKGNDDDNEKKKEPSIGKQLLDGTPFFGKAKSGGDKLVAGDYWGAAGDLGTATAELFTLGAGSGIGSLTDDIVNLFSKNATKLADETTVYLSKAGSTVQYAGITNNFAARSAAHLKTKGINIEPLMQKLSRSDARAVEQTLIQIHGLGKNGGTLLNKINSIAPSNPTYSNQLQRGYQLLKSVGYK